MTRPPDRLFDLLPVVHRRRDAERGDPLRALLQVVAEQVGVVEDDIEQLYENWFIETCEDWVVPYLAELIGYTPVHPDGVIGDAGTERGRRLNRILVPRREVANTLRYRRRKGTLALLELLAHDVAGWPARAVEFYRLLAWTQALNHQRLDRGRSVDLRDGGALDRLDGPFDEIPHSVDVRRFASRRTPGRTNIPSVGLFVWRLKAYPITRAPAYCLEEVGANCFTFSVLGNDTPLFTRSEPEPSAEHIAGPLEVPDPLRRRAVERDLAAYVGPGRSFAIRAEGWADHPADEPIPAEALIVADLSGWKYRPPRGRVAVDPILGRIVFPPRQLPRKGVWVDYHYGFSDDLGGGEYGRPLTQPADAVLYRVGDGADFVRINDALARWRDEEPEHAVVELVGSGVYVEQINIELREGQSLQLRAADRTRPVLRLMDWQTARPDALWVRGEEGSRFTLDGVLVAGRSVHCEGPLDEVTIRHSTLVPGWTLGADCRPHRPGEPSLELTDTHARVTIDRTILGPIQVSQDEVGTDPVPIRISDSILDATSSEREAVRGPMGAIAHATLTLERTTVFGRIETHAIELGENAIFMGRVRVARRQLGCMRFSYVSPGSRTPRRYRCQPDLVEEAVRRGLPMEEVDPDAWVRMVVGAGSVAFEDHPVKPSNVRANLELHLEADRPTPAPGDPITIILTVHNHGSRDARGLVARLAAEPHGCVVVEGDASDGEGAGVEPEDVVTTSQGAVGGEDDALVWEVGDLAAGRRAGLTVHGARIAKAGCAPGTEVVVSAHLTAFTLVGDGRAFLAHRIARERRRVRPRFDAVRYGRPTYAQLALGCGEEITRGADDESEMGAFHDLFQPQRAANLASRLTEFVPAGMDAGITYVT